MANNAEKNFHPAAYINFRKDEVFSRWVAVWFDFHPQLLPRSFPPSLFCIGFKLVHYIPFSESICFRKTLSNYWSLEVQKYLQFLILMNFHYLHIVMDAKRERKKKETPLLPSPLCPPFLLLCSLFPLLHVLANFQECHRRLLKMKLSFRSHTVEIYTQSFNLNHYYILSFSFYNNPLNAFKYGKGIATCRSKWNPGDL